MMACTLNPNRNNSPIGLCCKTTLKAIFVHTKIRLNAAKNRNNCFNTKQCFQIHSSIELYNGMNTTKEFESIIIFLSSLYKSQKTIIIRRL